MQGGADSGNHFKAVTEEPFSGNIDKLLQWLDYFLVHGRTEDELLDQVEAFLKVFQDIGFKLHAEKTEIFLKEARFCGRIITETGVRHDPRNMDNLLNMETPSNGAELQQILCATYWMRRSIPSYANLLAPLHNLLEKAYTAVGKWTKRAVKKFNVPSAWGAEHEKALDLVKKPLARSTELAHPRPECILCLFMDASETHWAYE